MNSCIDYYKYRNQWLKEKIYKYNHISNYKDIPYNSNYFAHNSLNHEPMNQSINQPMNQIKGERRGGIIVFNDKKLLVIHQIHSGYWGFPKGRLEEGETPIDGARRELEEETGIKDIIIPPQQPLIINITGPTYMFKVYLEQKPAVYPDYNEIDAYQWVTIDELKKLPISYLTKKILKKIEK